MQVSCLRKVKFPSWRHGHKTDVCGPHLHALSWQNWQLLTGKARLQYWARSGLPAGPSSSSSTKVKFTGDPAVPGASLPAERLVGVGGHDPPVFHVLLTLPLLPILTLASFHLPCDSPITCPLQRYSLLSLAGSLLTMRGKEVSRVEQSWSFWPALPCSAASMAHPGLCVA